MSTPMYDTPEHYPIGVNAQGQGPVDPSEPEYAGEQCGCGGLQWPCPEDKERE